MQQWALASLGRVIQITLHTKIQYVSILKSIQISFSNQTYLSLKKVLNKLFKLVFFQMLSRHLCSRWVDLKSSKIVTPFFICTLSVNCCSLCKLPLNSKWFQELCIEGLPQLDAKLHFIEHDYYMCC